MELLLQSLWADKKKEDLEVTHGPPAFKAEFVLCDLNAVLILVQSVCVCCLSLSLLWTFSTLLSRGVSVALLFPDLQSLLPDEKTVLSWVLNSSSGGQTYFTKFLSNDSSLFLFHKC